MGFNSGFKGLSQLFIVHFNKTLTLHHTEDYILLGICPSSCGSPYFGLKKGTSLWSEHSLLLIIYLSINTNKMQLCNRIYYSKVYWRLNMFRAAHRSSSGALNCTCSLWFIYPCGDRPLPSLGNGRSSHEYIKTRGSKYSLELLMMSGMPLETCWAFNKLWNNKFYYKAASCWYFYWVIYDARFHEYQIYRSNIKNILSLRQSNT